MTPSSAPLDPDRFFNRTTPGAHEWWYFDAISDDGRDVIVIVWYAGLPFDPSYGVATLKHLKNPKKYPQPRALDHSAIGFSWYRDGKPIAYALNGFKADRFAHQAEPFSIEISTNRIERDGDGYSLTIATPSVEGRPIRAEFRFTPAAWTESFERDLGTPESPHNWLLAASDCRVEGSASLNGEEHEFRGRGYHDHNAGAEDLSVAMKRWEWGRVHHEEWTQIFYRSETRHGEPQTLWIQCQDGRPELIREDLEANEGPMSGRNVFGVRHQPVLRITDGTNALIRGTEQCVDDGPFYRRWVASFGSIGLDEKTRFTNLPGIAELLDTRNLHKIWFNWMIPYRLKWPEL